MSPGIAAAVALGGALGALARFTTGLAVAWIAGQPSPLATLFVNIAGSFIMGMVAVALPARFELAEAWRGFLAIGFLGAFTTFSTFSLDAVFLYERGRLGWAVAYVAVSVAGSLGAVALGLLVARRYWE